MALLYPYKYLNNPFIPEKENRIWELINAIYNIMHSNEEQIILMKKNKYEKEWLIVLEYGNLIVEYYKLDSYPQYSWYWHYCVCHFIPSMDFFISLKIPIAVNKLSNQASELAHHYHQIITDTRAPKGKLSFPPGSLSCTTLGCSIIIFILFIMK